MVDAQVLVAPTVLETRSFDRPEIDSGSALLRVSATGLCGSDVASFLGMKSHDGPTILGHEVIGTVDEIGSHAARDWGVAVGDRVALEEGIPCMNCDLCRRGQHRVCSRTGLRYGYTSVETEPSLWGGFADLMFLHPKTQLHVVPEGLSDEAATLFIPLSNGLAWLRDLGELRPGEAVAVFGSGQHGLACALAAQRLGAGAVSVVGLAGDESRLALAEDFGCKSVIAGSSGEARDLIVRQLGGAPDVVVDMTPNALQPIEDSVSLAAHGGRVLWGGMKRAARASLDTDLVVQKELTVRGVWARASWAIPAAFNWLLSDPRLEALTQGCYHVNDVARALLDATSDDPAQRPLHAAITNR